MFNVKSFSLPTSGCVLLALSVLSSGLIATPAASLPAKVVRIAIYQGPGTGGQGPERLLKTLNNPGNPSGGTTITAIAPDEIRNGVLSNYDIVIFGGGSGSKEAQAIGETGRAQVEQFVANGGGYIGICAGAYLATSGYPWSLHLINARTLSPKWRRGKAKLKMELTPAGYDILGGSTTNLEVLYHNGPVVGPADAADLPAYNPLAYFRGEVASNNVSKGIMIDSPAIFAGQFKHGRVVCISPHPEQTAGLEYLVPHAVKWVAPAAVR